VLTADERRKLKWTLLVAAGLSVLIYCLAVVIYVAGHPFKGFFVFTEPVVASVYKGSSARAEGIRRDDVVKRIGDENITNALQVLMISRSFNVDDNVPFVVQHAAEGEKAKERVVHVKIERMPFPFPLVLWMLCSVGLITTSYVFYYRRSEDKPTTLFYLLCLLTAATFMGAFSWQIIAGDIILVSIFVLASALMAPVALHFFLIYPETSPLIRRIKFFSTFIYVPSIIYLAGMAVVLAKAANILGETKLVTLREGEMIQSIEALVIYQFAVTVIYAAGAMVSLWYCQKTTLHTDVKNQIKWVWWGVAAAVIPLIMIVVLASDGIAKSIFGELQFMAMLAVVAVLVATGLSLLKFRLMYVDTILNRSLAYVIVSGLMMAVYLAAVGVASLLLTQQVAGDASQQSRMPILITTLVIAFFFKPVSDWVQRSIDRRFFRERYEFQQAVFNTSQAIASILDLDQMLRQLMDTVINSLHVKRVAILLCDERQHQAKLALARGYLEESHLILSPDDPLLAEIMQSRKPLITRELHERSWTSGQHDEIISRMVKLHAEAVIPIIRENELLGLFVLGRKRSRQIYTSDDVRLIQTLANHTAIAINNARTYRKMETLNRDLQAHIRKIEEQRHEILGLQSQLLSENVYLKEEIEEKYNFQEIVGASHGLERVLETVKKVAPSPSAVLIRGESGTGKELIARAIHYNSPRRDKPFIRVSCAVLTESLLESELFGHEKGAFTGAIKERPGRFEIADGGTLFLDEIGDISPSIQVKLLRVLQEKEFERVGSNKTLKVDVRIITATNRNLEELMHEGRFREDLFYRLNVISILMPALRDRKEDVAPLAIHFLNKYARAAGKSIRGIDEEVLELFKRYPWPGNVRELENLIERAVVLADGATLTVADFPKELEAGEAAPAVVPVTANGNGLNEQLDAMERESLRRALESADGNRSRAAKSLGLARSTFLSKLKKYGLE
jgi:Nif-specific regulatory protein